MVKSRSRFRFRVRRSRLRRTKLPTKPLPTKGPDSGLDRIALDLSSVLGQLKTLGGYVGILYVFGFLVVRARLAALGAWTGQPMLDAQYLVEGAVFVVLTLWVLLKPIGLWVLWTSVIASVVRNVVGAHLGRWLELLRRMRSGAQVLLVAAVFTFAVLNARPVFRVGGLLLSKASVTRSVPSAGTGTRTPTDPIKSSRQVKSSAGTTAASPTQSPAERQRQTDPPTVSGFSRMLRDILFPHKISHEKLVGWTALASALWLWLRVQPGAGAMFRYLIGMLTLVLWVVILPIAYAIDRRCDEFPEALVILDNTKETHGSTESDKISAWLIYETADYLLIHDPVKKGIRTLSRKNVKEIIINDYKKLPK